MRKTRTSGEKSIHTPERMHFSPPDGTNPNKW